MRDDPCPTVPKCRPELIGFEALVGARRDRCDHRGDKPGDFSVINASALTGGEWLGRRREHDSLVRMKGDSGTSLYRVASIE
jgi:hypothetical protein